MNHAHYLLLRDKLLPAYKDAHLQVIAMFDLKRAKDYLISLNLHEGICYAAKWNNHELISSTLWVECFKRTFMGFWHRTPISCSFMSELVECLEVRITIMKDLIHNYELGNTSCPHIGIRHPSLKINF